jgi:hypothetical protein
MSRLLKLRNVTAELAAKHLRLLLILAATLTPFLLHHGAFLRWGYVPCFHDVRIAVLPMFGWVQRCLHAGRLPLAAPIFGGYPLYADPQALTFYPVAYLAGFLPTLPAFQALTLFHLLMAFAGCYMLGRQLKLGTASSLLLGLVWTGSGFFADAQHSATVMFGITWWPWLLRALLRLDERINGKTAAAAFGFGILQMLAGHPQMTVFFGVMWLAWLAVGPLERRRRTALASAAIAVSVIAVTAFAWMPWRMLTAQTAREPTPEFVRLFGLEPSRLPAVVLGRYADGAFLYFGAVATALAAAGAWNRRRFTLGLIALAALAMTMSRVNPLYGVVPHVPLLNLFRSAMRYAGITFFLFSILAAYGLERLRHRQWLQIAILGLVALDLVYLKPTEQPKVISFACEARPSPSVRVLRSKPPGAYFLYTHFLMAPVFKWNKRELTDPRFRLCSNENLLWGLPSVQGLSPLGPARQTAFLMRYGGTPRAGVRNRALIPDHLYRLRELGCRYVISTVPLSELKACSMTPLPDGMLLYDLGPAPAALLTGKGKVLRARSGDDWWEIEGTFAEKQRLIATIGYWPELRAWMDGREVTVRPNGPNPEVEVPPGEHRVRIEYIPTSLYRGALVSLVSLVILGAATLATLWPRRPARLR